MSHIIKNKTSQSNASSISGSRSANENLPGQSSASLSGAELDELMDNHFKHMFDVFNDGIFYMTDDDRIFFYNPTFYEKYDIASGQCHLDAWFNLVHPLDKAMLKGEVDTHFQEDDRKLSTQYRVKNKSGQYVWIEGTAVTKTINGTRFMIGCHRDISDRKLMETYVQQAAFRDNASGLSNGQKLIIDIDGLADQLPGLHSLVYIQIGDIRSYLSAYGPHILRDVMSHLITALNSFTDDFVDIYRVRSDDFAVLIRGQYSTDELMLLGENISKTYQQSVQASGYLYGADISIGMFPRFDIGLAAEEVIKIAARTCQFAGEKRHNRVGVYNDETKSKVDRHFYIERELANAIHNETLTVKFQPIICAKTNRVASFEALVRWKSNTVGEIYPDEFIEVAEKKGLIVELGYLVFSKACQFIKRYLATHKTNIRVNVNVSVLQLLNHQFPDRIKLIADQHGVDTKNIVLELTETIILDGNKSAISQLSRLSEYGFLLSLDDFGSGYSSLNSFFDLPLKQIKVDKTMAWRCLDNPATLKYLTFITQLCQSHKVDIVVEGIENAEMQKCFTDMGASFLQGYWFSKPLSLASASQYTLV
ncbi:MULTISPECIES: EAL domain-containing protein [Vibrio]|uniref:EAL domain-containing protein n=1 Tax=Vibrio TaxID=662 RepID=UPI001EFC66AE|nr:MULTISPECIES: EAL domain-containing protein [Vibrio]MCG9677049.1 EAL domain-containing protein [Vibrio sp. Isolate24]USD34296.1 EAL domain-containing protein [Vibrio sp. SCSIO 43186]USD47368.1 EAL domain-containing protein [Vibrio sp. SCSIO 43145]USD71421.1 EAL domain-containing protein [Vibrio sp. SCSIO 43139]